MIIPFTPTEIAEAQRLAAAGIPLRIIAEIVDKHPERVLSRLAANVGERGNSQ